MKGLINAFTKAGLHLEVLDSPIRNGVGMENIVQIDIQRGVKRSKQLRGEWFRIYPGKNTTVQVRGTDRKLKQLVLLVKEDEQEFHERVPTSKRVRAQKGWLERILRENNLKKKDVVEKRQDAIIVRRFTPADTRYFLMGVDERQLFVAQLTSAATSVQGARKLLGRTVQFAEGKRRGSSIDRQGEWFFLETNQKQRDTLDKMLKRNEIVVQKKQPIGNHMNRGGNPHTADELLVVNDIDDKLAHKRESESRFPVRGKKVFIRGRVRHQDHKTVVFHNWREVVANNEGATAQRGTTRATGVFWID